jgi:hypothetical protein
MGTRGKTESKDGPPRQPFFCQKTFHFSWLSMMLRLVIDDVRFHVALKEADEHLGLSCATPCTLTT